MNFKNLTKPLNTTCTVTLLGQAVFIRRLTSAELDNYNDAVNAGNEAGASARSLSLLGVNLFLSALVNEDGSRPKPKELPTAEELLDVHSNADLLDAVTTVQKHSWGRLEDAAKN